MRVARRRATLVAAVLAGLLARNLAFATSPIEIGAQAPSDPSPWAVVGVGLMIGAVDYFAGVAAHEGSHALTVELLGGDVIDMSILPVRQPDGHLYFGYTQWRGHFSDREQALILIAPKILDAALLATYTTLLETHHLPRNKYAQLVLAVAATGAWVDFTKDLFSSYPGNDLVRFFNLLGMESADERLPAQIGMAALSLASAVEIVRGYIKIFTPSPRGEREQARSGGGFIFSPNYLGYGGLF